MSPNWFWQEIKMYATMLFLPNLCNHHICLMYAIKTREFWSKERVEKTCFVSNSHTSCNITHVPKKYQLLQKQVNFLSHIIHQFCMLHKLCVYFYYTFCFIENVLWSEKYINQYATTRCSMYIVRIWYFYVFVMIMNDVSYIIYRKTDFVSQLMTFSSLSI